MNSLEVLEFKIAIENAIKESNIPLAVIQLILSSIVQDNNVKLQAELTELALQREREETRSD